MTDDPSRKLLVVRCCDPGDPAFNRQHPRAQELVLRYLRKRDNDSREALSEILHPGKVPVVFELAPLDFAAVMFASEASTELAKQDRAFRCACVGYTDASGVRHTAPMITAPGSDFACAATTWSNDVARSFGANAIREIGAVALRRAEVTAEAVDPYWPLRGAPPAAL